MKILLVNKFHYIKGGSETYYFGLAELLKKYGHEVVFFSMKDKNNIQCEQEQYFVENIDFNQKMSPIKLISTSLKMLYSFEAKNKFEKLLKDEKPDIIHLNIFQSQLTGSIVDVAHKYHIPVVYTAHDLKSLCPNYQMLNHGDICEKCIHGNYTYCARTGCMKDSRLKSILATIEAYIYKWNSTYKKLNLIITPSAFYKSKIEEAGIARCPIVHMANFLPGDTEYVYNENLGKYFLYFGRISREKGILTLIKAYAEAKTVKPLYIVGTGPIEEQVCKLIQELHMEEKIKMLGFKKGKELKRIVANALCVCLPSEWYENGPYSIMEAQAVGKWVLVSDNGGLPELVEEGVTGYIVTSKDVKGMAEKIKLIDNCEQMNAACIIQKGREKYNADLYLNRLLKLYKGLMRSKENNNE